jgi:hypothetical protein
MSLPEPVELQKNNKTVWIIVVVVALVLVCCLLVAMIGGLYYYLQQTNALPSFLTGNTPAPATGGAPTVASGPLVVEPFDPTSSTYPALAELVPNWSPATTPSSVIWSAYVSSNEPVLVFMGWCTTTSQILEQNYQHTSYKLVVDGQSVDVNSLFELDEQRTDRVCRSYVGLIKQWPGTQHTIVTTMTFDQTINDGWDDYPAGDYAETYDITVTP